eukprot:scaffold3340_cov63-Phaeocystis_antarctica.AAC.10
MSRLLPHAPNLQPCASQVRQLVAIAALSGRVAVLPSFNCSAPWLSKAAASGHMDDLRVVPVHLAEGDGDGDGDGGGGGGGGGGGRTRCAPCNVQFGCRRHVLSEQQWRLVERQHNNNDNYNGDLGDLGGLGKPPPGPSRRGLEVATATAAAAAAAGISILGHQPRQPHRERVSPPLSLRPPLRPRSSSSRRDRPGANPDLDLDLAAIWSRDEIDLPAFWAQLEAPDRAAPRGAALGAARVLVLASLAEVRGVAGGRSRSAHNTHVNTYGHVHWHVCVHAGAWRMGADRRGAAAKVAAAGGSGCAAALRHHTRGDTRGARGHLLRQRARSAARGAQVAQAEATLRAATRPLGAKRAPRLPLRRLALL